MPRRLQLNWIRTLAGVFAAEALPILALVAVVFVYGFLRKPESPSPQEFAPVAGSWVGPFGGFLATLLFAFWAAKRNPQSPFAQGIAVGVGTALLDLAIGIPAGGIGVLIFVSNAGRIIAGILGGWLGSKPSMAEGPQTGASG
jgi:hypothetical protein